MPLKVKIKTNKPNNVSRLVNFDFVEMTQTSSILRNMILSRPIIIIILIRSTIINNYFNGSVTYVIQILTLDSMWIISPDIFSAWQYYWKDNMGEKFLQKCGWINS